MSGETTSPNMSLPIPGTGLTGGPTWANDLNACLTLVDSHNHSAGQGVPVTPDGLNINADLTMLSNNLTGARSLRMTPQSAVLAGVSDLGCLSVVGVDLYFNDVSGNKIQITQSGGVAGTPGSISNLVSPATAAYVGANSTFVWQSAANTPAIMDGSSVIIRNLSASSKGLTLAAPLAMAADYSLTLPSLPGSTKIVSIDSSGNFGSVYDVDNSTLQISSNVLKVKDSGITTAKLAAASVTPSKVTPLGQQVSTSSGVYTVAHSTAYADVTNLTVTITTTGRPVDIRLIADGSGNQSYMQTPDVGMFVAISRDGTRIAEHFMGYSPVTGPLISYPTSSIMHFDPVTAGTYAYKIQVTEPTLGGGATGSIRYCKLLAFEII